MIMLGVALAPSDSYACGSKSGKSCCKKENVESHSTKKSAYIRGSPNRIEARGNIGF